MCQFGSDSKRPIRIFGFFVHESLSPKFFSGRYCFGVQGMKHRRCSREDEDRALVSIFHKALGLSKRHEIPRRLSPSPAAQPSLDLAPQQSHSSSSQTSAQTTKPVQPSEAPKSSPKSSDFKSPIWPSSPIQDPTPILHCCGHRAFPRGESFAHEQRV